MAKVDILLASYNGEKYIEAQLLSILSQTYKDWKLLIHDDGSSDRTINIIKYWQDKDSRILLLNDGIKCGGAANNFLHLLKYSNSDFIMFCDQDDIWFDNKIQIMYDEIMKERCTVPHVLYSNSYAWKSSIGILGNSTLTFPEKLQSFLFLNSGMQGCVAIFNDIMRTRMLMWKGDLAMHDHLLHLIGLSMGKVSYIPNSLMLYRNHENNVTGMTRTKVFDFYGMMERKKIPVIDKKHYLTVSNFQYIYKDLLADDTFDIINTYIDLPKKSFINKLWTIVKYRFKVYNSVSLLLVKLFVKPYIG